MTAYVPPASRVGCWGAHPATLGTRIPESRSEPSWRSSSRQTPNDPSSHRQGPSGQDRRSPSGQDTRRTTTLNHRVGVHQPRKGQVLFLPAANAVPETSIFRRKGAGNGSPWTHPVLVVSVDDVGKTVTFLQITSIPVMERATSLEWARRYVPINHKGTTTQRHPIEGQPHLTLLNGGQMKSPSSVNVDGAFTIEWEYLSYMDGKTELFLEEPSVVIVGSLTGSYSSSGSLSSGEAVQPLKRKRQESAELGAPLLLKKTWGCAKKDVEHAPPSAPAPKKRKDSALEMLPTPPSPPEPEEPASPKPIDNPPKPATRYVPPHKRGSSA